MIKNFYKNKRVLITGVTGFKGAWLSSWLILLGAKVYGTGFNPNKNKNLFYKLNLQKKINLRIFDIRDLIKLEKFIKEAKPQIIFHLAAQPIVFQSYRDPKYTFETNINGTLNILEVFRKNKNIKSLVCVTSDKCYENMGIKNGYKETDRLGGVDPYSASKACAEQVVRAYRESYFRTKDVRGLSTARAGNVIGGGDWSPKRLIPDCIRSILKNKKIIIRNPKFNRPWLYVLEPLRGYLILAYKQYKFPKKYSQAWNFGTIKNSITDVEQIVSYIIKFWGSGNYKIKKSRFYEQHNLQLDIEKSKKILGWKPIYNIQRSVEITTKWYSSVLKFKSPASEVTNLQIKDYMNDNKWR